MSVLKRTERKMAKTHKNHKTAEPPTLQKEMWDLQHADKNTNAVFFSGRD